MNNYIKKRLIVEFRNKSSFTRNDLYEFFKEYEPGLKDSTFAWRIHNLKKKNIIKSIKRAVYVLTESPDFKPEISSEVENIAKIINSRFQDIIYCIWESKWLNEFSVHQASKNIIIVEIEKYFAESLFYELKGNFNYDFFLNPTANVIDLYIAESRKTVVIKNIVTRSPVTDSIDKSLLISIPKIEKILVDLYSEKKLLNLYQGAEIKTIYENVIKNYSLNFTSFFSYAKRRNKEKDIKDYLKNNLFYLVKDLIDD